MDSGRKTMSIDFKESLKIGAFHYHDFFGDGSFYLLDTPGVSGSAHKIIRTRGRSILLCVI